MHHSVPKQLLSMANFSLVEDEYIENISTRPAISRTFSSIDRKIEYPPTHC